MAATSRPAPQPDELAKLQELLSGRTWVALTGAGMSTDSGIPDYRGPGARPTNPVQYADFVLKPEARRRYWARSMMGYRSFGSAAPNPGHQALARLGVPIITQNVDGLHSTAGSAAVIDLHGRIERVICLDCQAKSTRDDLQRRLEQANPQVTGAIPAGHAELRPDGDADIADPTDFRVVSCQACAGTLKPDVVFFGENVPVDQVTDSFALVDAADVLVVAGSSLTVFSGLRFVRHAAKTGTPVVIINHGPTRGDDLARLKITAGTSETLTRISLVR
ncbi:MAG: Sir2 family NAD-dependent protein deacetylase [Propioniciclava sp.]